MVCFSIRADTSGLYQLSVVVNLVFHLSDINPLIKF